MRLKELLEGITLIDINNPAMLEADVSNISVDNRNLKPASVFFAFKGTAFDAHDVLDALLASTELICLIGEKAVQSDKYIQVENGREALSRAAVNFYNANTSDLKKVGITGTNGKTTIAYIMDAIFAAAEMKSIRIGTTEYKVVDTTFPAANTTPGPMDLGAMIASGSNKGASGLVMEVSSHALSQHRVAGLTFDAAIFTNLTGDHLDYHGDMESYFHHKKTLFTAELCRIAVINIDSPYGERLISEIDVPVLTCSVQKTADICVVDSQTSLNGTQATLKVNGQQIDIKTGLTGQHNLSNILCAVGAAVSIGISLDQIIDGVEHIQNIPGRLEKLEYNGAYYFVDYAHTDDALENVLSALNELKTDRIITLFGCGGDRDKTKRPRMARAAEDLSDVVIVTSDNPRTENPTEIISDIVAGLRQKESAVVEPDRRKAIAEAVEMATAGDIILIAGKGHEDYQIIGTEKFHFDDLEELQKLTGVNR